MLNARCIDYIFDTVKRVFGEKQFNEGVVGLPFINNYYKLMYEDGRTLCPKRKSESELKAITDSIYQASVNERLSRNDLEWTIRKAYQEAKCHYDVTAESLCGPLLSGTPKGRAKLSAVFAKRGETEQVLSVKPYYTSIRGILEGDFIFRKISGGFAVFFREDLNEQLAAGGGEQVAAKDLSEVISGPYLLVRINAKNALASLRKNDIKELGIIPAAA